ncbi:hypothetical protein GCM10010094_18010 [Streptomyces flaveus]|uniref:ATP-dependent RNA helicase HrpB C-terminal domain-containing protein n=1 Tax=Streptomyces flaveus TaxID=66370 RepID=A0A917VBM8_9ACTN|nr:hypothetical protein GCM10010094_18010 [Streptomyces flaveus]
MSRLGLHPRLARALLDAAPEVGADRAAEVVALLSEEPPREYGDDLAAAWRTARRGGDAYARRWRAEARRLRAATAPAPLSGGATGAHAPGADEPVFNSAAAPAPPHAGRPGQGPDRADRPAQSAGNVNSTPPEATANAVPARSRAEASPPSGPARPGARARETFGDDHVAGLVAALAFPERVARAQGGSYLMVSGTRAELGGGTGLRGAGWLAVAVADRPVGAGHARVRLGAVVDEETARRAAGALHGEGEEVRWAEGDVVARRVERLGAVELAVRPIRNADSGLVRQALLDGLREEGLGLLRWSRDAEVLRQRLGFLRRHLRAPWPDVSDDALHARVDDWLEPELSRARRRADLARIDAGQALGRLLPWASGEAARFEELAPERIEVPSGSRIRIDYADPERPVLAVKLQEMFGLQESPAVAGVPVLVHLLSPAGRPAAVTADLASFWRDGYRGVRAELRGRYPKHPWPEDPATAEPTRYTNARLRR